MTNFQSGYAAYGQYLPPHTTSVALSPPTSSYSYLAKQQPATARIDTSLATMSPISSHAREPESTRPSVEPQARSTLGMEQSSARWRATPHLLDDRPTSSSSSMHSGPVDSWTVNPLGIQTNSMHQDQYYPSYHHLTRSPRMSEPLMDLPSHHHLSSPQPRRLYTPIAPQPLEPPRSTGVKRGRSEDQEGKT